MTSRFGYAWLLLPLPAVLGAFIYSGWVFGNYSWGYLGLMQIWALAFILGYGLLTGILPKSQQQTVPVLSHGIRWDVILLVLGALAVAALFFDRYFLRGIDYFSVGMAKGRALLNQGTYPASFFSVFGNFFLYSYLFPLIRSVLLWEERTTGTRSVIIAVALLELVGVSYLMGGRTAILLTITVCLASFVARRLLGKSYRPHTFSFRRLLLLALVTFTAFGVFFWFRSRAFGDGDSLSYFLNICGHLTRDTSLACDFGLQSGPWKDIGNYLHLVLLYGVHGTWLSEEIVQTGWSGGWITSQGLYSLVFSRLGLEAPPAVYEGFFIPAPASVVNDFGVWGMVGFALFFGTIMGVVAGYVKACRIGFAVYVLVFGVSFWFLSFLIFPTNIPGFVISILLGLFLWCMHLLGTNVKGIHENRPYKSFFVQTPRRAPGVSGSAFGGCRA